MDLEITSRHFKPSSQLTELVNEKVAKVAKFTYDISRTPSLGSMPHPFVL